jgi:DNA-binding transcriptional MerR regulator
LKWKISEVAKLAGVTVRTLHYYDEIGLLTPCEITKAGYRLYDDQALNRLQQILFFRELDFPLNQIKEIVTNPTFDASDALRNHRALLIKKRKRVNRLIELVDATIKGGTDMSFEEFDLSEIEEMKEKYTAEARERWGDTSAYAESMEKTAGYDQAKWKKIQSAQDSIFQRLAKNMDKQPDHPDIQALIQERQDFITDNFYRCSKALLQSLAQMNLADERFRKNIDNYAEGLTAFIAKATNAYCESE